MFKLIRKEYIYVLMVLVIIAANLAHYSTRTENSHQEQKDYLSTKTLKEIGITEKKVKDFLDSGRLNARFFKYSIFLGTFVFILSIILNLRFILRRKRMDFKSLSSIKAVPWGIADLIKAGIVIIFFGYVIGFAEAALLKMLHFNMDKNLGMMLGTFFVDIIALAVLIYFTVVKYKQKIDTLGLKFKSILEDVLSGLSSYIFILPLLLIVLLLSAWILDLVGYSPPPQPVFDIFMEEKRSNVLLFLTVFVSIFGPIVEEIFFRGFMYTAIKKRLGFIGAGFLSAAIFSSLHTNIIGFFPIMVLGLFLAYLYEKTNSLIAPIAAHITHNSIIVAFVFFIKELMG